MEEEEKRERVRVGRKKRERKNNFIFDEKEMQSVKSNSKRSFWQSAQRTNYALNWY